jgi:hypothetical protein
LAPSSVSAKPCDRGRGTITASVIVHIQGRSGGTRAKRSWAGRSKCHHDAFESYRMAAILNRRDRSGAAETTDGRFHKSIELGGRAPCSIVQAYLGTSTGEQGRTLESRPRGWRMDPTYRTFVRIDREEALISLSEWRTSPCAGAVVGDRGATKSLRYTRRLHAPWRF